MQKNKQQVLSEVFGFDEFRPLQEAVIDKILNKEDILLILPTGGGKSLCYQLPALLQDGVLVVVSPLLALMQDQIYALKAKGIKAAMMSSLQDNSELFAIENQLKSGQIKVLFVAPERLVNDYFLQTLSQINISFFAIDEAHCVSEWGHEFRADYRKLSLLKQRFPDVNIAAFTATATKEVEQDIVKQLNFKHADNIIRGELYRKNLKINAIKRESGGKQQLLDFLQNHADESGIIYTLSRKNSETIRDFLLENNYKAISYHAGLSTNDRKDAFNKFVNDDIDIVVATIAFGMGIDKSNIRFVVHLSMPKTIESYYQEMGRAGRDGLESEVLLLYNSSDLGKLSHFLNDIEDEDYRNRAFIKLNLMKKYAFSEQCRHQSLSRYFDDDMPACKDRCDNCADPDQNRSDITKEAQMFLSAIYRTKQLFGQSHIIDVLRGSKNKKVLNNNHNELSVYAIGEDISGSVWRIICDRLLEIDAINIVGEYKSLKITAIGQEILKSQYKVDIRQSHLSSGKRERIKKVEEDYPIDQNIFNQLRALRKDIATAEKMPAYIIFDDKTLKQMAYFLPNTEQELLKINGVGQLKLEKYGSQFLTLLQQLRGNDFVEKTPAITSESQAENGREIKAADQIEKTKKLHPTCITTLELINQNNTVEQICAVRGFTIATILGHINKLADAEKITREQRLDLFNAITINPAVFKWIEQGLELADSMENIQHHLTVFRNLHNADS